MSPLRFSWVIPLAVITLLSESSAFAERSQARTSYRSTARTTARHPGSRAYKSGLNRRARFLAAKARLDARVAARKSTDQSSADDGDGTARFVLHTTSGKSWQLIAYEDTAAKYRVTLENGSKMTFPKRMVRRIEAIEIRGLPASTPAQHSDPPPNVLFADKTPKASSNEQSLSKPGSSKSSSKELETEFKTSPQVASTPESEPKPQSNVNESDTGTSNGVNSSDRRNVRARKEATSKVQPANEVDEQANDPRSDEPATAEFEASPTQTQPSLVDTKVPGVAVNETGFDKSVDHGGSNVGSRPASAGNEAVAGASWSLFEWMGVLLSVGWMVWVVWAVFSSVVNSFSTSGTTTYYQSSAPSHGQRSEAREE